MDEHKPALIEHRQIADTILALKFRCCGDPATETVFTVQNTHRLQPSDIEAEIERGKTEVRGKHQATTSLQDHIENITGVPRAQLK